MYYCKDGILKIETQLQCLQRLIGIGIDSYILFLVWMVFDWTTIN